jgi:hypothetical protein
MAGAAIMRRGFTSGLIVSPSMEISFDLQMDETGQSMMNVSVIARNGFASAVRNFFRLTMRVSYAFAAHW